MARIAVVTLLTALEAVTLLDAALMLRAGINPIAFVLAAAVYAPWLIIEVRRALAARAPRAAQIGRRQEKTPTARTPLAPEPVTPIPLRVVHTAATNPTGKRIAA